MENSPATSASSGLKKLDISHLFQFFELNDPLDLTLIQLPDTDGIFDGSNSVSIQQPRSDSTEVQNTCFTEFPTVSLSASEALLIDSVILQTEENRGIEFDTIDRISCLQELFPVLEENHGKQLVRTASALVGLFVEEMVQTDNFMPRTRRGPKDKSRSTYPKSTEIARSWIRRSSLMFGTWGQKSQVEENKSDNGPVAAQEHNLEVLLSLNNREKVAPVRQRRHSFRWRLLYWRWKRRLPKEDNRCLEV